MLTKLDYIYLSTKTPYADLLATERVLKESYKALSTLARIAKQRKLEPSEKAINHHMLHIDHALMCVEGMLSVNLQSALDAERNR